MISFSPLATSEVLRCVDVWEEQGACTVPREWNDAYSSRMVINILPFAPRLDILPAFPCRTHLADTAVDACQISNQDAEVTLLSLESIRIIHLLF